MSTIGIEALLLQLASVHLTLTHHQLMEAIELVRALVSSYRLAASEPDSSVIYGRFSLDFFRTIVACLAR
jgi:hypothetical protein